jgi:hypothetical protein
MASRQQLIIERLAQLTQGFARYVAAYDELVPFNSKQLATHRETIALRSQAGSVRAAVTDLRFATSLRRTLLAWGLGVRGSVLVPDAEFAQALTAAVPVLERLEDLRIDAPDLPGDLIDQLWTAITVILAGQQNRQHALALRRQRVFPVIHRLVVVVNLAGGPRRQPK